MHSPSSRRDFTPIRGGWLREGTEEVAYGRSVAFGAPLDPRGAQKAVSYQTATPPSSTAAFQHSGGAGLSASSELQALRIDHCRALALLEDERGQAAWLRRENRNLRTLLLAGKGPHGRSDRVMIGGAAELDVLLTRMEQYGRTGHALPAVPSRDLSRRLDALGAQHGVPSAVMSQLADLDDEIGRLFASVTTLEGELAKACEQRDDAVGHLVALDGVVQRLQGDLARAGGASALADKETASGKAPSIAEQVLEEAIAYFQGSATPLPEAAAVFASVGDSVDPFRRWAGCEAALVQMLHASVTVMKLQVEASLGLEEKLRVALADVTTAADTTASAMDLVETFKRQADADRARLCQRLAEDVEDAIHLEARMRSQIADRAMGGLYHLLANEHYPWLLAATQEAATRDVGALVAALEGGRFAGQRGPLVSELSSRLEEALADGSALAAECDALQRRIAELQRIPSANLVTAPRVSPSVESGASQGVASGGALVVTESSVARSDSDARLVTDLTHARDEAIVAAEEATAHAQRLSQRLQTLTSDCSALQLRLDASEAGRSDVCERLEAAEHAMASLKAQSEGAALRQEALKQRLEDEVERAKVAEVSLATVRGELTRHKVSSAKRVSALEEKLAALTVASQREVTSLAEQLAEKEVAVATLASQASMAQRQLGYFEGCAAVVTAPNSPFGGIGTPRRGGAGPDIPFHSPYSPRPPTPRVITPSLSLPSLPPKMLGEYNVLLLQMVQAEEAMGRHGIEQTALAFFTMRCKE